jgi:carboxylesterase
MDDLRKEYYFKGNSTGCLLIHGFTGTPAELRELGEKLRDQGYTVLGVRLHGHGTTAEELSKCSYKDWIKSVEEGYKKLKSECSKIYVIGHSMGSLLSLYCAENYPIDKVAALSPPIIPSDKRANFAGIFKYFMKYDNWPARERSESEAKYLLGYSQVPVASVHEFNKIKKLVVKNLNKIHQPLLVVHSLKDETIENKGIDILLKRVGTKDQKVVYLQKSGHNITVECEKEIVFDAVINFCK